MIESFTESVKDFWETIVENAIDIGIGLVIFLLFFILRKQLSKLFSNIGKKLFSKKPETGAAVREALLKPMQVFCTVLGAYFGLSMMPFPSAGKAVITTVFRVMIIYVITWITANFTPYLISKVMKTDAEKDSNAVNDVAISFLSNISKVVVYLLGIAVIISELGFNITALITGLGLGGLTFSLAAQETAKNLFSGFAIVTDKPFDVGDRISTADIDGTVESITMRSTRVRTFADTLVVVPNSVLVESSITNWSRMNKRFSQMKIGLTYDTDAKTMQKCIDEIDKMLHEHTGVDNGRILVTFDKFSDSSLDIGIIFFTKPTDYDDYLRVCENINFKIKEIVENNGASFAFPSRSVYIEQNTEKQQA